MQLAPVSCNQRVHVIFGFYTKSFPVKIFSRNFESNILITKTLIEFFVIFSDDFLVTASTYYCESYNMGDISTMEIDIDIVIGDLESVPCKEFKYIIFKSKF